MSGFNSYQENSAGPGNTESLLFPGNPIEEYDIADVVDKISSSQAALDAKVHAFLSKVNSDKEIAGNFNINEEWRCWLERDTEASLLLFDPELSGWDEEAVEAFADRFSGELKNLLSENDAIDKMARSIDEFRLFKICLYNVFNNGNNLPLYLYFNQVFSRAKDFGMVVTKHSKDDFDLMVSFNPLEKINRGSFFLSYELYMRFNQNHKKECHMYSVGMMDANSADVMYSGPVSLPVRGAYSKFTKDTDAYFLTDQDSVFYQQTLKNHRRKEKEKYGIPADYFEGTFIDRSKLVNFSEKSYQYGNSKIFIPKSQIAFSKDKVYMKRWLYAKLKRPVEQFEASLRQSSEPASLDEKVASAAALAAATTPSGNEKGCKRDFEER